MHQCCPLCCEHADHVTSRKAIDLLAGGAFLGRSSGARRFQTKSDRSHACEQTRFKKHSRNLILWRYTFVCNCLQVRDDFELLESAWLPERLALRIKSTLWREPLAQLPRISCMYIVNHASAPGCVQPCPKIWLRSRCCWRGFLRQLLGRQIMESKDSVGLPLGTIQESSCRCLAWLVASMPLHLQND